MFPAHSLEIKVLQNGFSVYIMATYILCFDARKTEAKCQSAGKMSTSSPVDYSRKYMKKRSSIGFVMFSRFCQVCPITRKPQLFLYFQLNTDRTLIIIKKNLFGEVS